MFLRTVLIVAPFCILAVIAATEFFLRTWSGQVASGTPALEGKGLGVAHRSRWQGSGGWSRLVYRRGAVPPRGKAID